jgi:hypothetical protein
VVDFFEFTTEAQRTLRNIQNWKKESVKISIFFCENLWETKIKKEAESLQPLVFPIL